MSNMITMLRMMGLTLPIPVAMSYCWTQAVVQAELGGGQQTFNSIGLMLILVVLPLTLMFILLYLIPIIDAVGKKFSPTLRHRMVGLTAMQTAGTFWGYLVLNQLPTTPAIALAVGGGIGLVGLAVQWVFFPRPIDTTASQV